jgi:type III restriction enzyme
MSLQFRIPEQLLRVDDTRDATEAGVHRYDAFLNLLCEGRFEFQRDAVREAWRFLVSDKYPDLERLARINWDENPMIRARHEDDVERFLERMPLRAKKAASVDLATGTGKSYVMYALAVFALAEGLVDRVLVLCPSLTIEEGLLEKFRRFVETAELGAILREVGAAVPIPGIKRGNETIDPGDICVENIHAVYEATGSSIRDSFRGRGARTLVLNDEAHHLFSPPEKGLKKWMEFLLDPEFDIRFIVNVTGTAFTGDDYFPDVVHRYGLKQAIADKVVKKPNYKLEDTLAAHTWEKTYAVHQKNRDEYGSTVKPISIVVTQEIARCVEVWDELVRFLMEKEGISRADAEAKAIWVTSGVPSAGDAKKRVEAIFPKLGRGGDGPEKRRQENLGLLKGVDDAACPVEWIVSVSMLTEGWDVKNVFQIVPHESRAFNSRLLIAQVLGRGLRVPPGMEQPLVTINNHEAWKGEIGKLLEDVLEIENVLSWGYDPRREKYVFPLHNLRYAAKLQTVEKKKEKARAPQVVFRPQERRTTEWSKFSITGHMAVEVDHRDILELEEAVRLLRLFLREKDAEIGRVWTPKKIRDFIVAGLKAGGYDTTFLSKENLLLLQHSFGPMFRGQDGEHPRFTQEAGELETVDLMEVGRQSLSESTLKEDGGIYYPTQEPPRFTGAEGRLWEQYQEAVALARTNSSYVTEDAKQIASRLHQVDLKKFKTPWNFHYSSHEPERKFSDLIFLHADLFEAFVKMPDRSGYRLPISYKPAKTGRTHPKSENFHPDYFLRLAGSHEILVVEVKQDGDDSKRNRAKCRDGERHFETLNRRLEAVGEAWRYRFYFLAPENYTDFFKVVADKRHVGWRSKLMQELVPAGAGK